MSNYALEYADGRVSEIVADTDTDAITAALDRFDEGAVVADQWDADGQDHEYRPRERILIWSSEEDSENDSGATAIAQLIVTR